jgi:hypothetical protein
LDLLGESERLLSLSLLCLGGNGGTDAALSSGGLGLRRLLLSLLLFGSGLSLVLVLKLLELLETLVGGLLLLSLVVLLGSILPGLFFVEPGTVLEHLLNLLRVGILGLLLLRERLTGSTKLVGLSRAVTKVEPVHDARDLFFGDVTQRVDTSTYSTESALRVTE